MNSNIRSVIRLKSPSIKLLWLLIYNLHATGRLTQSESGTLNRRLFDAEFFYLREERGITEF